MPQMSPMDWYFLSIFFLLINFLMMMMIYFLINYKFKKYFLSINLIKYKIMW